MNVVTIAGPDPCPKKPDLPTPSRACDCHAHIFGPSDRFPYTEGRGYTPPDAPVEKYLSMHDALGIERGVVVQGNAHGYDNSAILEAVARYPDRLRGVAITDDSVGADELRRWNRLGIRGLRFHLYHRDHRPSYKRGVGWSVFEKLRPYMMEMGWHMQVWVDWRAMPAVAADLKKVEMPVVVDHMLGVKSQEGVNDPGFQALLRLLGEGKCWVKLSAAYHIPGAWPDYPEARPFQELLIKANPERLVWGTNWPHPQVPAAVMPNDGNLLDLFNAWTPNEEIRRKILVENPARLYGFEP